MEIEIIKSIQTISTNFLDSLFILITKFGEVIFFEVIFALLYWCFSKRQAIKLGLVYCMSAILNSVLKILVKRPRPYVADSSVRNVYMADGYSFPSGHSMSYSSIATFLGWRLYGNTSNKSYKITFPIIAVIMGLLVGFSRMYLGQHYLTDVLCGLTFGFLFVCLWEVIEYYIPKKYKNFNFIYLIYGLLIVCGVGSIVFIIMGKLDSSLFRYMVLVDGLCIGHIFNEKLIHFDPQTTTANKSIIACIGYLICAIIYLLFSLIQNVNLAQILTGFIIPIVICALVPMIAKLLENKKVENK